MPESRASDESLQLTCDKMHACNATVPWTNSETFPLVTVTATDILRSRNILKDHNNDGDNNENGVG